MSRINYRLKKPELEAIRATGIVEVERSKRLFAYGEDYLEVDNRQYVLTDVRVCSRLDHPHKRPAYVFTFKNVAQLAAFHTHIMQSGRCIFCGFVPRIEE